MSDGVVAVLSSSLGFSLYYFILDVHGEGACYVNDLSACEMMKIRQTFNKYRLCPMKPAIKST